MAGAANTGATGHPLNPLAAAILSTAALGLLIAAAASCSFLVVGVREDGVEEDGNGNNNQNYLVMLEPPETSETITPEKAVTMGILSPGDYYDLTDDPMWIVSRAFMFVSLAIVSMCTVIAWAICTVCLPTWTAWKLISALSALSAVTQVPIFLLFEVEPCSQYRSQQICSLSVGSAFLVASIICSIAVTAVTQCLDPPMWVSALDEWRVVDKAQTGSSSESSSNGERGQSPSSSSDDGDDDDGDGDAFEAVNESADEEAEKQACWSTESEPPQSLNLFSKIRNKWRQQKNGSGVGVTSSSSDEAAEVEQAAAGVEFIDVEVGILNSSTENNWPFSPEHFIDTPVAATNTADSENNNDNTETNDNIAIPASKVLVIEETPRQEEEVLRTSPDIETKTDSGGSSTVKNLVSVFSIPIRSYSKLSEDEATSLSVHDGDGKEEEEEEEEEKGDALDSIAFSHANNGDVSNDQKKEGAVVDDEMKGPANNEHNLSPAAQFEVTVEPEGTASPNNSNQSEKLISAVSNLATIAMMKETRRANKRRRVLRQSKAYALLDDDDLESSLPISPPLEIVTVQNADEEEDDGDNNSTNDDDEEFEEIMNGPANEQEAELLELWNALYNSDGPVPIFTTEKVPIKEPPPAPIPPHILQQSTDGRTDDETPPAFVEESLLHEHGYIKDALTPEQLLQFDENQDFDFIVAEVLRRNSQRGNRLRRKRKYRSNCTSVTSSPSLLDTAIKEETQTDLEESDSDAEEKKSGSFDPYGGFSRTQSLPNLTVASGIPGRDHEENIDYVVVKSSAGVDETHCSFYNSHKNKDDEGPDKNQNSPHSNTELLPRVVTPINHEKDSLSVGDACERNEEETHTSAEESATSESSDSDDSYHRKREARIQRPKHVREARIQRLQQRNQQQRPGGSAPSAVKTDNDNVEKIGANNTKQRPSSMVNNNNYDDDDGVESIPSDEPSIDGSTVLQTEVNNNGGVEGVPPASNTISTSSTPQQPGVPAPTVVNNDNDGVESIPSDTPSSTDGSSDLESEMLNLQLIEIQRPDGEEYGPEEASL